MSACNKLELNLEKIKANEAQSNIENRAFMRFLEKEDEAEIETLAKLIIKEVKSQINCQLCGNCCKSRIIDINRIEANAIAKHLEEDPNNFWKENITGFEGDPVLKKHPCTFLNQTECTLGDLKPKDCKEYPYFFESKFAQCMHTPILNYPNCPITYNVLERLKIVTRFSPSK